ncbi:MAG: DNA-binding response regulator [Myxococcales bacterium]
MAIRVALVEDHLVVREGLVALLRGVPDMTVVGEATDLEGAARLAETASPDVVVMDVGLPGPSGIEATRRVLRVRPEAAVVILSMRDDAATVDRALRAGARGYVLKGRGVASLCEAIRATARGEVWLSPEVSELVLQGYLRPGGRDADPLTEREREVLQLVGQGLTSAEIADRLGLRTKTVQNYRTQIMDKLGVRTTAGLVRYVLRSSP